MVVTRRGLKVTYRASNRDIASTGDGIHHPHRPLILLGSAGNDLIYGNEGSGDSLNGGSGTDRCSPANGGPPTGETVSSCELPAP